MRAGTGDPVRGRSGRSGSPRTSSTCATAGSAAAPTEPDYNDFAPRLGIAWTVTPEDRRPRRAAGSTTCATSATRCSTRCGTRRSPSGATSRPRRFRPNLSYEQPFARTGAPTFILATQFDEPSIVRRAVVARRPARAERQHDGRSDLLRLRRRAPAPAHELQQPGAEPAGQLQPGAALPEVRQHPGDERAEQLAAITRSISSCSGASRSGLSFLSSFSYGKSIDNGSGIRTSDGDSLTPSNNYDLRLETRALGLRLPAALDDVVAVGSARSARTSAG